MKFLFAGILAFISQIAYVPTFSLLLALALVVGLDFLTGCYKARRMGQATTSQGFRKTVDKFISYGVAVVISTVLCFVTQQKGGPSIDFVAGLLNDGLVILIIYIEVVSICENTIEINPGSPLVLYFFAPLHKILTLQLKNNPVKQKADAIQGV